MTEITKANILNSSLRYRANPRVILSPDEVTQEVALQIPRSWLSLLSLGRVDFSKLRELWFPVSQNINPVLEDLESRLQGLAILMEDNHPPSLLYIFQNEDKLYYHRGYPPLKEEDIPQNIKYFWAKLPKDFKDLYTIHNGWFYISDISMGHMPVNQLSLLSWEEWSLESEVVENIPVDIERTAIVFTNGGSGYMGFELPETNETIAPKPLVFWSDKPTQPDLNIEFWSIFNTWIGIGLQDMDYNEEWMEE